MRPDRRPQRLGRELCDCTLVEDLALDRRPLDHGSFAGLEPVEAGGEQCVDRRRHGHRGEIARRGPAPVLTDEQTVVDQHRQHLLDEERIALRRLRDALPDLLGQLDLTDEVLDQAAAFVIGERLEQDRRRVQLAAAPARADVEQLRAGEADEQDRGASSPVGDVLDEIEERRLAPVDVVEDEHERMSHPQASRRASARP